MAVAQLTHVKLESRHALTLVSNSMTIGVKERYHDE